MLKELIAQVFCREIGRKLRRLGVLGSIVGAYFAFHVELPLEISIATKEAQVMMVNVQHTAEGEIAKWRRQEYATHLLQPANLNKHH
jgi:hypothetical protein